MRSGFHIEWATPAGVLVAIEPSVAEVEMHAPALAAAYNDPHNARLLGHTAALEETDVVAHYAALRARGGHGFLLLRDGALAGDGDLRDVHGGAAEFAFLIAAPAAQGQGLGTRFALMIHALAFGALGLDRVYAAVVPQNPASRRVFEKLGYQLDPTDAAQRYGDPGDIVLRLEASRFVTDHAATLSEIRVTRRA